MTRRHEPLGSIDDAITRNLEALTAAEAEVRAVLDRRVLALDEIEAEINAAEGKRRTAYEAVRQSEKAIEKLGYVVVGLRMGQKTHLETHEWYSSTERENARARVRTAGEDAR